MQIWKRRWKKNSSSTDYRLQQPKLCILWEFNLGQVGHGSLHKPSPWLNIGGDIPHPPESHLYDSTHVGSKTYAMCSCASGGVLTVRCCNSRPGEILKYGCTLRPYPVNFKDKLHILDFILAKLFWPPFYCGKLLNPPLWATQTFFVFGPYILPRPPIKIFLNTP